MSLTHTTVTKKMASIHKNVTFLAFGANAALSLKVNIRRIAASRLALERRFRGNWRHARYWRSAAWPAGNGPDFVNSVSMFEGAVPPEVLLRALHHLEARAGRVRDMRWGPRVLDIDLLAVGSCIRPDLAHLQHWIDLPPQEQARQTPDRLLLPHPRLQDRAFVLAPLCDLAPHWRHPVTGQTARAMLAALPAARRAEVKPLKYAL